MKNYGQRDFRRIIDGVFLKKSEQTAIADYINENKNRRYSYGKLKETIGRIGETLEKNGIYPPERVALPTKPSAKSAIILLALSYLGYTAVIPDVLLPKEEQNRLIEFTEPSAVIIDGSYNSLDDKIKKSVPVFRMFTDSKILKRLNTDLESPFKSEIKGSIDVMAILFSSGTTGSFKGVEVTYQSMIYATKACMHYSGNRPMTHFLHILPLSHIAGYTMMNIIFLKGFEIAFMPEISASALAMGFKCYQPTDFVAIPKVYETIHKKIEAEIAKRPLPVRLAFSASRKLSHFVRIHTGYRMRWLTRPFFAPALGRNMEVMGCGTSACNPETIRFFLDMGVDILNVYGSTEAAFPISAATVHERYPDTGAGFCKEFPYINVKIEDGEILVKSPLVMRGYFRDPVNTKNAFTADGWLRTGDLGKIDEKGRLYITGRKKETIQLKNGTKVSAQDVDNYYSSVSGNFRIASCGVPDTDSGTNTEHIVLFIETENADEKEINSVKEKIRRRSDSTNGSYRLSDIFCIKEFPCTSTGKIQRFKLREKALSGEKIPNINSETRILPENLTLTETVCEVILKYVSDEVTPDMRLSEDLNIDSITMFEICSELQTMYGTDFMNRLGNVSTVKDLADIVNSSDNSEISGADDFDVNKYPLEKSDTDRVMLNAFANISKKIYKFEVEGTENLSAGSQYIFCPNHESHLDGLWVISALKGHIDCRNFSCLAKQEHLNNMLSRFMLRVLGGIPIDRSGNPAPALSRAIQVLKESDVQFLVHPEGTRTRTGVMGKFKKGVAELSIDSGIPLVPVFIKGAYQIFPADRLLPRFYDFREHKQLPIKIVFGKPIMPDKNETPATLTEKLRFAVEKLREESQTDKNIVHNKNIICKGVKYHE
ncbi:MAG: AMP-binding protein [Ruminococcus sp.]|nr:AMP-binding protein [Ruminococcus sp.]